MVTGYTVDGADNHAQSGVIASVWFGAVPVTAMSTACSFAGSPAASRVASHIRALSMPNTFVPSAADSTTPPPAAGAAVRPLACNGNRHDGADFNGLDSTTPSSKPSSCAFTRSDAPPASG